MPVYAKGVRNSKEAVGGCLVLKIIALRQKQKVEERESQGGSEK